MNTNFFGTVLRGRNIALVTLAVSAMVTSAYADTVTVNGFQTTSGVSNELTTGQVVSGSNVSPAYTGATLTNWTNTNGYTFVFVPGSATANSAFGPANVTMYNNPTVAGTNVVALDSDFPGVHSNGSISQTLHGLDAGGTVTISFGLALDQQDLAGKPNATPAHPITEDLVVTLGGQSQTLTLTYDGTTTWGSQSVTFNNVVGGSEALTFLADNGPEGGPSFVLLDDPSASQTPSPVPEPGSLALLSTGLIGLGGLVRSRFKK
jgi:hypothetical protein